MSVEDFIENKQLCKDVRDGKLMVSNGRLVPKQDLSLKGYISKHGGIKSPADNKVYTSERAYKQHLKDQNLRIMDDKEY